MSTQWQSILAPCVVFLTMALFAWRLTRKKKPGCGSGCGCGKSALPEKVSSSKAGKPV